MPPPQDETTEQHGPSSPGRWVSAPHPAHRVWAGSSLITGAAAGPKTQSRPQPLHARFHEQWGTIPSQSSTWPRHLPTEAGRARGGGGGTTKNRALQPHKPRHGHRPSMAGPQKCCSNFSMGFWAKKLAGGVVLDEPQPCCPHCLSCSILRDYKMAVKPVPQQQLAQNHLRHLILEKQRQNLLLLALTPGQHL